MDEIRNQVNNLKDLIRGLNNQLELLKADIKKIKYNNENIANIEKELDELVEIVDEINEDLNRLYITVFGDEAIPGLVGTVEKLTQNHNLLANKTQEVSSKLIIIENSLEDIEKNVTLLSNQLKEVIKDVSSHTLDLGKMGPKIDNLKISILTDLKSEIFKEIEKVRSEMSDLKVQLTKTHERGIIMWSFLIMIINVAVAILIKFL